MKRKRSYSGPTHQPMVYRCPSPTFKAADHTKRKLLEEADLLIAMGDQRGRSLKVLTLVLPLASLERLGL